MLESRTCRGLSEGLPFSIISAACGNLVVLRASLPDEADARHMDSTVLLVLRLQVRR